MRLYHGSNVVIESINLAMCRPYKDFGKGFYLTDIEEQAKQMANRVSRIYGGSPVINTFEIQDDFRKISDIKIKDFGIQTTEEWAKFVMNNRNRTFTDDNMALLFRQYENEIIDFETLLKGMIYKKTSSQYSFHTEKGIRLLRKADD